MKPAKFRLGNQKRKWKGVSAICCPVGEVMDKKTFREVDDLHYWWCILHQACPHINKCASDVESYCMEGFSGGRESLEAEIKGLKKKNDELKTKILKLGFEMERIQGHNERLEDCLIEEGEKPMIELKISHMEACKIRAACSCSCEGLESICFTGFALAKAAQKKMCRKESYWKRRCREAEKQNVKLGKCPELT